MPEQAWAEQVGVGPTEAEVGHVGSKHTAPMLEKNPHLLEPEPLIIQFDKVDASIDHSFSKFFSANLYGHLGFYSWKELCMGVQRGE